MTSVSAIRALFFPKLAADSGDLLQFQDKGDSSTLGPESANNQLIDDSESSASQHQPDGVDLKPEC